jgi:hypothetical protein
MKWKTIDRNACLHLLSALILVVGLSSAMLIYRTAENHPKGALGYEEAGGSVYPVMPGESKKYLRDMELYGGKANVIADEMRRWFVGLWQGRTLAYTVACLAIVISFGVFYAANHMPSRLKSGDSSDNHWHGTG